MKGACSPSLVDRFFNWFRLLGKYSLSSLIATGFDFLAFSVGLSWLMLSAVKSTVLGRCVGALVAFWLHRKWVFERARTTQGWQLGIRYLGGVLLGMGLNVGGVWLLHNIGNWNAWPARITSAVSTWFLVFLFNKYIVFNPPSNRRPFNYRT